MEKRIIIAGSGGQGILFFGRLTAYAAMLCGKEVTWFPSYGAEIRGGTANCTVVISDAMIGSPVVRNPDILVALNEASFRRFAGRLLPGGLLLYDSSLFAAAPLPEGVEALPVPASDIAASLNTPKSANVALMGALIAATNLLPLPAVFAALDEMTPAHRQYSLSRNKDLIQKGYQLIEHQKGAGSRYQAHS